MDERTIKNMTNVTEDWQSHNVLRGPAQEGTLTTWGEA